MRFKHSNETLDEPGDGLNAIVRRIESGITSAILVCVGIAILSWGLHVEFVPLGGALQSHGVSVKTAEWIQAIVVYAVPVAVFVVDGAMAGATYGMRKRKLRFYCEDGMPAGKVRSLVRILVGIAILPMLPVSLCMLLRDERRRSLADRLCKTIIAGSVR